MQGIARPHDVARNAEMSIGILRTGSKERLATLGDRNVVGGRVTDSSCLARGWAYSRYASSGHRSNADWETADPVVTEASQTTKYGNRSGENYFGIQRLTKVSGLLDASVQSTPRLYTIWTIVSRPLELLEYMHIDADLHGGEQRAGEHTRAFGTKKAARRARSVVFNPAVCKTEPAELLKLLSER